MKLRGIEDEEDIGNMMVEGVLAKVREDRMIETKIATIEDDTKVAKSASKPPSSNTSKNAPLTLRQPKVEPVSVPTKIKPVTEPIKAKSAAEPMKAEPAAEQIVPAGTTISRGVLPVNNTTVVGVCFLDTPEKSYSCPSSCFELFMTILSLAQSAPPGLVIPVVGSSCLAMDEDCWYRAEMVKLSADKDKATLFLLDYGKTVCMHPFLH